MAKLSFLENLSFSWIFLSNWLIYSQVDAKCEFAYETIGQIEIQRENMEAAVKAFDQVGFCTWRFD